MKNIFKNKRFFLICSIVVWIICFENLISKVAHKVENNAYLTEKYEMFNRIPRNCNRIFLGDSRTHQGLIPEILDKNSKFFSWNLADPGMQAPFYFLITKRFLESGRKLDMIIMNISFYLLGSYRWMNDIYLTYYKPNITDWLISLATLNPNACVWYLKSRIPSWRHYKRLKPMIKYDEKTLKSVVKGSASFYAMNNNFSTRGYLSRGEKYLTETHELCFKNQRWWTGIPYFTNNINLYFFRALFLLARFYNIKIYVYEFPFPDFYQKSNYFTKIHSHYKKLLDSIIDDYYPFVERLPNNNYYESEYLVDYLHCNQKGAERLSTELATLINERENDPLLLK